LIGKEDVTALAFDPGDTDEEDDDRLLALVRVAPFEDLFEIDPDDASVSDLDGLSKGVTSGFQGLAYDSVNDKLYTTGYGAGLYEIDYSCPDWCTTTLVPELSLPPARIPRPASSLAYSEETGRLYVSGSQAGPRSLFDSIDATSLAKFPTIGIDDYTPGGLAAIPVPEPHPLIFQLAGGLVVAGLARRRRLGRMRALGSTQSSEAQVPTR
jgi:hypothetical protein